MLGKLLRAARSAVYALAGIEAEPASAPPAKATGTEPADLSHAAPPPAAAPVAPVGPAPALPTTQTAMPGIRGTVWDLPARGAGMPRMGEAALGLPAPEAMRVQAGDAVELARTRFQVELDYSEGSLESVEWILGVLYDAVHPKDRLDELMERVLGEWYDIYARYFPRKAPPPGPTEGQLWQMARIWGAYVGEVMRARWNGQWAVERPTHGEAMIALRVQRSAVFPLAKVYERLANGPSDNIWFFYRALKERFEASL